MHADILVFPRNLYQSIRGGVHIHITMQDNILASFS